MIDRSKVVRAYSGKSGCMCGCKGTYNTDETSKGTVTKIVNKLNESPNTKYLAEANCFYLDENGRNLVVYVDPESLM